MSIEACLGSGLRRQVEAPAVVAVAGGTAREALDDLIAHHPALARFVLDDARRLRRHVNLFINEVQVHDRIHLTDPLQDGDRLHILPAVSGGAAMPTAVTEPKTQEAGLLVCTRKGLLVGRSQGGRAQWDWSELLFGGWIVSYAARDPYTGDLWCAASHWQWGPRLHRSSDGGGTWTEAGTPAFADGDRSLAAVWTLEFGSDGALYAGVDPGAVFSSRDGGRTWQENEALSRDPLSVHWMEGAAGKMFHAVFADPADPQRLVVGGSACGTYASYDGGETWSARNDGVRMEHLPPEVEEGVACVHSLHAHPAQRGRLWQQSHFGQYRSDDDGASWVEVSAGLPGDFGFASAIDPRDPDVCYFIPLDSDQSRFPRDRRLEVYRTADAGDSWQALTNGLPARDFHQSVYRQALAADGCDPLGLYVGTSGGELYASPTGGDCWTRLHGHLAPITAVRAFPIE